ncbi:MAG TPA: hypothetical protein DDW52_00440 [Planctomycetaceae bacterium]|nr:hypothetical protein [Planctomycetaceae bacterium]
MDDSTQDSSPQQIGGYRLDSDAEAIRYEAGWQSVARDAPRQLYVHSWRPDSDLTSSGLSATAQLGHIAIVHGLGEHGGRYDSLARRFCQRGFSVHAFDQQGHGQSRQPRGLIESYESMLDDISHFLKWVGKQGAPVFLFGHSMGGNLVLNHALRVSDGYQAVVSSSPMIRAQRAPGRVAEWLLRWWSRMRPRATMTSNVVPERLMNNPAEIAAFEADTLFHSTLSLKLGAALIDSGRWALKHANELSVPLLLSHGDTDVLTCPQASQQFAETSSKYCEFHLWPDFLHDPFRCLASDQVVDRFADFFRRNVEDSGAAE